MTISRLKRGCLLSDAQSLSVKVIPFAIDNRHYRCYN
jgi:hypothetical protein